MSSSSEVVFWVEERAPSLEELVRELLLSELLVELFCELLEPA
jgi:hypothetical protein